MRRSSLSVGVLSLLHATDLWCHCEDDEITLLQLNTRVQAQTLPSVESQRAKSALESAHQMSHPHAEALLESVRHLARQKTSESPEVVNTAIEAVKAALAQMRPKLIEEHEQARLQIQRQWQEIQACHSSEEHGATVVGNLVSQTSTIQQCRDAVDSAGEHKEHVCGLWHNHATVLQFPECVVTTSGSEAVYSVTENLFNWVTDAWPQMQTMRGDCTDATAAQDAAEESCRPVIDGYDDVYCDHYLSCTLLSACHNHEVGIYNLMMTETMAAQTSRQDQWRILMQANCILDLITGGVDTNETVGDESMSSCNDATDVDHLTLNFEDPQHWPECPARSAGDPQCPAVQLPDGWDDGAPVGPVDGYLGYHYGVVGSTVCEEPVSESNCLAAVQQLLPEGQVQGRTYLVTRTDGPNGWGWLPPYCSVQSRFDAQNGDWAAYYNPDTSGYNDGGYTPVCTTLPS